MATSNSLNVFARKQSGRSASRRLRKNNQIPAILYGKHTEPSKLSVDAREFRKLLKSIAGRKTIIELKQDGQDDPALSFLQEVQRDPITDIFLHADFQEIRPDEKFEVEVPVRVFGECHGVRYQNGILEIATHSVRVRCLAKDLPGAIEIDISKLEVDKTIKVRDLPAISKDGRHIALYMNAGLLDDAARFLVLRVRGLVALVRLALDVVALFDGRLRVDEAVFGFSHHVDLLACL